MHLTSLPLLLLLLATNTLAYEPYTAYLRLFYFYAYRLDLLRHGGQHSRYIAPGCTDCDLYRFIGYIDALGQTPPLLGAPDQDQINPLLPPVDTTMDLLVASSTNNPNGSHNIAHISPSLAADDEAGAFRYVGRFLGGLLQNSTGPVPTHSTTAPLVSSARTASDRIVKLLQARAQLSLGNWLSFGDRVFNDTATDIENVTYVRKEVYPGARRTVTTANITAMIVREEMVSGADWIGMDHVESEYLSLWKAQWRGLGRNQTSALEDARAVLLLCHGVSW